MEHQGRIIQLLAGFYDILNDDGSVVRTRASGNLRQNKNGPVVGDWVSYRISSDLGYLTKIHKRRNVLDRPPVANVDQVVLVISVINPDLSTNLLDRQLISLEIDKIKTCLYFSKVDLLNNQKYNEIESTVKYYEKIGYKIFFEKGKHKGYDLNNLSQLFSGLITVISGQTGAGKTTLLNNIDPSLELETGEISSKLHRGKHTTRKVSLFSINNGLVADTPGFSSYDVLSIPEYKVKDYFIEFRNFAKGCRFKQCLHLKEPNCQVKLAVSNKDILSSRYDNYEYFVKMINTKKNKYKK